MSEALIFASTNPQYDDRLFIEFQVQYMKIPSSKLGEHVVYRSYFWHSEQFLYKTGSPHVLQKEKLQTKFTCIINTALFLWWQIPIWSPCCSEQSGLFAKTNGDKWQYYQSGLYIFSLSFYFARFTFLHCICSTFTFAVHHLLGKFL